MKKKTKTPVKGAGGRRPSYDWSVVRREYIRGDDSCTLESLSVKTGYPALDTLKRRSAREDWPDLRREFRHRIDTRMREVDRDLRVEIRTNQAKLGKALINVAVRGLSNINPKDLEPIDVARFAKIGAELERKALGMEEVTVHFGHIKSPEDLDKLSETDLWSLAGQLPPQEDDDDL